MHGDAESEETPLDWIYNAMGIFSGVNESQYDAAVHFDEAVTKEINKVVESELNSLQKRGRNISKDELELNKNGIGHSLGGNLIQMLSLTYVNFNRVYAINDAPPSSYQLANIDAEFRFELFREFNLDISNFDKIYTIPPPPPPSELKAFTENHYKEKGQNIHHLTNEEDMLFAASDLRGFLNLGSRTILDSDADFVSIRDRIGNLSDEDLYEMQKFLVKYAPAYKAGGYNGLIKAMTGVDLVLLQELKDTWTNISITDNPVGAAEAVWETVKKFDEIAVNLKDFAAAAID
ncbi:hypothetical protein QFZ72_000405 [Bacillus sp. V2I10]|nr:hypothetical protein [Bacillus sp. V2I10]